MFSGILIDPPWPERGSGKVKRGADRHYPLIKTKEEILRVIVTADCWTPADDCHLYLWSTNNYLPWAMWLMPALGFKYKTCLPWVKSGRLGLGQYFRGCHEMLLFGVRGKGYAVKTDATIRSDVLCGLPRPKKDGKFVHSAKPEEVYGLVELRTEGPYLEMFARKSRDGWTSWGNEVP